MQFFLHKSYKPGEVKHRRAEMLVYCIFLSLTLYFFYLGISIYVEFFTAVALISCAIFLTLISLLLLKTPLKYKIASNIYISSANMLAFGCMYLSGGIHSPIILWMISPPLVALLIISRLSSFIWAGISLLQLGYLIYLDVNNVHINSGYNNQYDDFFYFTSFAGLMVIVFFVSILFENSVGRSQKAVNVLNKELIQKNEELNIQTEEISSQRDMLYDLTKEMERQQQDIIELNSQLENRINVRTMELYSALKELDTFIYRSAHDLKGPLTTISGLCYVSLLDIKDEKAVSYINKIQIQTQKTIYLLQRIAGINELKKLEPVRTKINFKLIQMRLSRYLTDEDDEAAHVQVNINIPSDERTEFYSDQLLLETIVIDLFDNAIKFRDSFKQKPPYAYLNMKVTDGFLHIRMEDNGLGITENIKSQIFDMFFKGSDKSKGSGLGLFIVKIVTEKLHGEIELDTSIKGKTVFNIKIPSISQ